MRRKPSAGLQFNDQVRRRSYDIAKVKGGYPLGKYR